MEQEISIEAQIDAAFSIEKAGVPLELFAVHKGGDQSIHHFLFLRCETRGVHGINGGRIAVFQGIAFPPISISMEE